MATNPGCARRCRDWTDAELLRLAADDGWAMKEILRRWRKRALPYARYRARTMAWDDHLALAEDLLQEALTNVWPKIADGRVWHYRYFRTALDNVANDEAGVHGRREGRKEWGTADDLDHVPAPADGPDSVDAVIDRLDLNEVIDRVDERGYVRKWVLEEVRQAEIAADEGIKPDALRKRIERTNIRLREELGACGYG